MAAPHVQTHCHTHTVTHTCIHTHTHTHTHCHTHMHAYIHSHTETFGRKCQKNVKRVQCILHNLDYVVGTIYQTSLVARLGLSVPYTGSIHTDENVYVHCTVSYFA